MFGFWDANRERDPRHAQRGVDVVVDRTQFAGCLVMIDLRKFGDDGLWHRTLLGGKICRKSRGVQECATV
jgi:hypothetical protein